MTRFLVNAFRSSVLLPVALLATGGVCGEEADGETTASASSLYWIPVEQLDQTQLTEAQKQRLATGCCGLYLPPPLPEPRDSGGPDNTHIVVEPGGQVSGDPTSVMTITGQSTITRGRQTTSAQQVELDQIEETTRVSGDISIYDSANPDSPSLIIGDSATLNRVTDEARIQNGEFVFYETGLRGRAGEIHQQGDAITLTDGAFTQCEPGHEHWLVRGSEITLDREKEQGVAKNMRLELGGVPVFYFPWISFPIGDKSKTGFLYPDISTKDLSIPYFISLAPNYDLTFAPRFIRERGTSFELEGRHLSRRFRTTLGGAWMADGKDDVSDNEQDAIDSGGMTLTEATEFDGEDRWLASVQQTGGTGSDWYTRIDATKVSDYAYFHQVDTANLEVNRSTYLRQQGELGYNADHWLFNARWAQYQNLVTDIAEPYKQKPRLAADGRYRWGSIDLGLRNEVTRFEASDTTSGDVNGDRLRTDYQLDWRNEALWGFFTPSVLLKTLSYKLDRDPLAPDADDNPGFVVPQASLDTGLFFERDGSWLGDGYLQTFEPRLFYFYSDYENQDSIADIDFDTNELTFSYNQLFRHTRFSGGDRIDDANQVSVGLTTRFIGHESGKERLSLSLGQIFYQDDRRVTLDGTPELATKSEIAGQVTAQLTDFWRFSADALYDPETQKTTRGSLSLRYLDDRFRLFNIDYHYLRKPPGGTAAEPIDRDESQLDLSFVWPLSSSWSVIARSNHDFTFKRELDTLFGLEYTGCCYRVRLMGRRWLDNELINRVDDEDLAYESGIFLEIHLRGLGLNLGNRMDNALRQGIVNYDRREAHFLDKSP